MKEELNKLREQVEKLEFRLNNDVSNIKANSSLKWSLSTYVMTFLSVIFALSIAGQILNLSSIREIKDKSEKQLEKIENALKSLKFTEKILITTISTTTKMVNSGYGKDISEKLEPLKQVTKEIEDIKRQYMNRYNNDMPNILNNLNKLQIVATKQKCQIYFEHSDKFNLKLCAEKLLNINEENSHGYHYLGHYYYLDNNDDKAIESYKKSISVKLKGNRDSVNLAEYMLKKENYIKAYEYSSLFLNESGISNQSSIYIIAQIFKYISGSLSGQSDDLPNIKKLIDSANKNQEIIKSLFDSTLLNKFRTQIELEFDKHGEKKNEKEDAIKLLDILAENKIKTSDNLS